MFHLIPAPLHRSGLRLAHAARKLWWRVRRPRFSGVRVLALDADGGVLLIRHSYGSGKWMLPGGGLTRGEDALAGAARELFEETACRLAQPVLVEEVEEPLSGATNCVSVVAGWTADAPRPDAREVLEARFFALDRLPEAMPEDQRARLPRWITAAKAARQRDAGPPPSPPPAPTG